MTSSRRHYDVMELAPYLDTLHRDLTTAAAPGGDDVVRAAGLLTAAIEASGRLVLLEALSDAAAEITTKLDGGSVEVRLRGREAQFVVSPAPAPGPAEAGSGPAPGPALEEGDIARITLRLPESLKDAVEGVAATLSLSVNAWLVRAITNAITAAAVPPTPPGRTGRRITGFAQA
jgi:hypothetical protein